jgi:hypothetical protein
LTVSVGSTPPRDPRRQPEGCRLLGVHDQVDGAACRGLMLTGAEAQAMVDRYPAEMDDYAWREEE